MAGSDRLGQVCPPVVKYTAADQARAAEEADALPDDAMVVQMLSDYAVLRDQTRLCQLPPV